MKPNNFRLAECESAATDWHSTARHCVVLTLIGLAAIAVAIMLPRDETARPAMARDGQTAEPASQGAVNAVHLPGDANTIDPAGMPFDYFPAQFPAPQGQVEEQPPTF
jgi:hypothetical protein